ncbi:MAG TPA: hypothetical protein PLD57_11875 [Aggregatilineales bacterium]|nr:hypothetical protein [Aggregatilineales bacterium]
MPEPARRPAWWLALLIAALVPLLMAGATHAAQGADPRFGVVEAHDAPEDAAELGAGWSRARFHWGLIQPDGPDQWIDAELTEAQLAGEQRAGREVVGLLIGVPEWAADDSGLPRGLDLPPEDDGNLWANFVREVVSRYAGRIDHWIVWNEPDVWDPTHPAFTWPGTLEDYVQLLKTTYLVARETNPDAVIHLAAMSHWWDVEHGRDLTFLALLDAIVAEPEAAEHNYYYDVATLNLYFNPATVYEVLEMYQGFQSERGLDKPFWLVETNAAPSSDPAWPVSDITFRVSLLEQAAYMPQALALALAAGAERVAIYKLVDTPGDITANPEPFGLVREDGSHRPAFTTARVAMRALADAGVVTWSERGEVSQVVTGGPGKVTRILWNRVPEAQIARIPALASSAVMMDMWGNETPLVPENGEYTVPLYAGECQETVGDYCMIGGPPVYVIERVGEGAAGPDGDLPGIVSVEPLPSNENVLVASDNGVGRRSPAWWLGLIAIVIVVAIFEFRFRRRLLRRLREERDGDR